MYFNGVETYETTHRAVYFSNGVRTQAEDWVQKNPANAKWEPRFGDPEVGYRF
jgi:hypothetical protein